ncbi:hypothetical protein [Bradyrhizobium sp. RP6]|uniref:hypothetical protein n=1 Tax=Bradyrhizobium sp. RP6 TaxID=2489596 RepID=UPI000F542B00|nr:hypothetical protein [Bradyrhizobium sp. RP6]RQH13603.1 hypothetical protein EHH60_11890 [Bradyrhizobium sp. RP6]
MSVDQDKETLLDALHARQLSTGKRPSIWEAQMHFLPEWGRDRLFDAAQALEDAGDILNVTGAVMFVDLASTARQRVQARAGQNPGGSTTYNIGSVHNSPFQHIAAGGHGVQATNYNMTANDLRAIVDLYKQHVGDLQLDASNRQKADKAIATIEAQLVDNEPDNGIVTAAGKSLKTIIEGALGGALGNAVASSGVWAPLLALFS